MTSKLFGIAWILLSAAAFGAMPIFARFAYASGVDPVSLLFFRFLVAAMCMGILLLLKKESLPSGRVLLMLVLLGMIGYAGQSIAYFTALTLIPASLLSILLYLYPVIVMFLSVLFLKETISPPKVLALALALGGIVLLLGFQTGGRLAGVLLGLCAALMYSFYIVAGSRVMQKTDPLVGCTVVIAAASASFGLMVVLRGVSVPETSAGWFWIACIAVLCTTTAIVAFFKGLKLIGPVDASLISTFEPVTTVSLACSFLGERISAVQVAGIGMILAASILLARRAKSLPGQSHVEQDAAGLGEIACGADRKPSPAGAQTT